MRKQFSLKVLFLCLFAVVQLSPGVTSASLFKQVRALEKEMRALKAKIAKSTSSQERASLQKEILDLRAEVSELKRQYIDNHKSPPPKKIVNYEDQIPEYLRKLHPSRYIPYYSAKNPYIESCLNRSLPKRLVKVSREFTKLCRIEGKKRYYSTNHVKYRLYQGYRDITISADIHFNYKGRPVNRKRSFARMKQVIPCMEKFFARHGLALHLRFHESVPPGSSLEKRSLQINLWDYIDRASSKNWVALGDKNGRFPARQICTLALHEFGHILGLPDTYRDHFCTEKDPATMHGGQNLMSQGSSAPPFIYMLPKHIKRILHPLCG